MLHRHARWTRLRAVPASWRHVLYTDSKTMLEDVRTGSRFTYYDGARRLQGPVDKAELRLVTSIELDLTGGGPPAPGETRVSAIGEVGR